MPHLTRLGFLGAAALAACTHDAPPTTPPTNVPAQPVAVDTSSDGDLALIPAKASFVIHVDLDTFRTSPIYTHLIAPQLANAPELALVTTACGFDPMALVTSLTFATIGGMSEQGSSELVVRGIPRDRALACLPALIAKLPPTMKVNQDRDTWVVTSSDNPMAIRFVGDTVAVVAIGPTASQAGTDALIAGSASALPSSAIFTEMRGKLRARTVWFVITPPAVLDLVPMMGIAGAFGSLDVRDGVAIDATLRFENHDRADRAAGKLKSQLAQFASIATRFDVTPSDKEIAITAQIDHDKMASLLASGQLGQVLGLP